MSRVLGLLVVAGLLNCNKPAPTQTSSLDASASSVQPPSIAKPPSCDALTEWLAEDEDPDARKGPLTARFRSWSPECRALSMHRLCDKDGCSDAVLSDIIMAAASTPNERDALLRIRLDDRSAAIARARRFYARTKELVTYATVIINSPRASAYNHATTLEEQAEEIANGNPCLTRLRKDFDRVESVRTDLNAAAATLSFDTSALDDVLVDVKSCVACDDDRSSCTEMIAPLQSIDDALRAQEDAIAVDRKRLGLAPTPVTSRAKPRSSSSATATSSHGSVADPPSPASAPVVTIATPPPSQPLADGARLDQARAAATRDDPKAVRNLLETRVRNGHGTLEEAKLVRQACKAMGDRACSDDVKSKYPSL